MLGRVEVLSEVKVVMVFVSTVLGLSLNGGCKVFLIEVKA